eukprot:749739-Hanusia_phi.AAC.1
MIQRLVDDSPPRHCDFSLPRSDPALLPADSISTRCSGWSSARHVLKSLVKQVVLIQAVGRRPMSPARYR